MGTKHHTFLVFEEYIQYSSSTGSYTAIPLVTKETTAQWGGYCCSLRGEKRLAALYIHILFVRTDRIHRTHESTRPLFDNDLSVLVTKLVQVGATWS